jgi:hypothetical protein
MPSGTTSSAFTRPKGYPGDGSRAGDRAVLIVAALVGLLGLDIGRNGAAGPAAPTGGIIQERPTR